MNVIGDTPSFRWVWLKSLALECWMQYEHVVNKACFDGFGLDLVFQVLDAIRTWRVSKDGHIVSIMSCLVL
jgi:hypothetical protein